MQFFPDALLSLDWVLLVAAAWLVLGIAGLIFLRNFPVVAHILFPLSSVVSIVLTAVGLTAVVQNPQVAVLPLGLPGLPFHFRLDALAAFFVLLLGVASAGISIFAAGYFRRAEGAPPGLMCLQYHVFLASMLLVLTADDAYAFMVMWETMALSSFFLVTTNHRIAEIRRAGYLYILVAHIGAIAILLCFGVLQANTGDYTFANMRAQTLSPFWASAAFLLALFGFGAKAGILPLHIWLPEAHPAAPSPVSALMSGVMLKIAFEATPDPKLVVAVGECGCNGGVFGESYASCGRVSNVIPVDVAVPGCPPPPLAILQGILTAVTSRTQK